MVIRIVSVACIVKVVSCQALKGDGEMAVSIRIAPPHSMVFVSDHRYGDVPEITREARIWATSSCIAIGCLSFMDGETEIVLGRLDDVDPGGSPALDQELETPFRTVVVSTSEGDILLSTPVTNLTTHVRVWTNRASEPDKVVVGVD
jgi:hypothetical protein